MSYRYIGYISGPMSGYPEHNFPAFFAAEDTLVKAWNTFSEIVNPARMEEPGGIGTHSHGWYLRRDLKALLDCDAIILLDGWEKSVGARAELNVARVCEMDVYVLVDGSLDRIDGVDVNRSRDKTIADWQESAYRNSVDHGFHQEPDLMSVGDRLLLMVSEVTEAFDELRSGHKVTEVYYDKSKPDKPEGVPIELADVVIRVLDFCGRYGIDLEQQMQLKHAYNVTRPALHGRTF